MSSKWEALKSKGNEEYRKNNYSSAISMYTEAIKLDSTQDSLFNNRGLCYLTQGNYVQAKSDLNKAINLNPKNVKALKRLSYTHTCLGELSEAEIFFSRCIEIEPDVEAHKEDLKSVKDLITAKDELSKAKFISDWKTCEEKAVKLVEKCNQWTEIKLIYVESLINVCKVEEALNFLKGKFREEEKQLEEFSYLQACAYYTEGKYEKSRQCLSALIARAKDCNLEKYNQLWERLTKVENDKEKANECFKRMDYDGAIELYTQLIELDNNNKLFQATILSNRSLCYQKKHRLFEALKDINQSINLNSTYWKAYYRRATIHIALKNADKAKEDLSKVIQLDPINRDAHILLDDIMREEKKVKRRDFYKILEVNKTAGQDEIRKAFKRLAGKWHPDKNTQSTEQKEFSEKMFKDINEAYNILSNQRSKVIYDAGGHPDDPNSFFHSQTEANTNVNYENFCYSDKAGAKSEGKKNQGGSSEHKKKERRQRSRDEERRKEKEKERDNNKWHKTNK